MSTSVSLPKQFSEGNPVEWLTRFENCCRVNGWEDNKKLRDYQCYIRGGGVGCVAGTEQRQAEKLQRC